MRWSLIVSCLLTERVQCLGNYQYHHNLQALQPRANPSAVSGTGYANSINATSTTTTRNATSTSTTSDISLTSSMANTTLTNTSSNSMSIQTSASGVSTNTSASGIAANTSANADSTLTSASGTAAYASASGIVSYSSASGTWTNSSSSSTWTSTLGNATLVPGTANTTLTNTTANSTSTNTSAVISYTGTLACTDNDTSSECTDGTPVCDLTIQYNSLQDLANANVPPYCVDIYSLQILQTMLTQTLANYTATDNGYDDAFNWYVKTVKEMVSPSIEECMSIGSPNGPCNQFFDCTYAPDGHNASTETCPGTWQGTGEDDWTMYYTLTNATGFYDTLQNTYGINQSWVMFGNPGKNNIERRTQCTGGSSCSTNNNGVNNNHYQIGFPMAVSSDSITVSNPADIINAALPNISSLQDQLDATYSSVALGLWDGSNDDPVQALSVPVFMLDQAVQTMGTVKTIGDNAEEEAKKNLIITILGAVFCIVPFVGEGLDFLIEAANLGRMAALAAEGGNAGLSIEGIATDPASAPLQILGMMLGGAGGEARTAEDFAAAAKVRRSMTDASEDSIGGIFKANDGELQDSVKACIKV